MKKIIGKIIKDIYLSLAKFNFFNKLNNKILNLCLLARGYSTDWKYLQRVENSGVFLGEKIFLKKLNKLNIKKYIDIGTNKGKYSLEILKNNKENQVFAFEPMETCLAELEEIKNFYKERFHYYSVALSDEEKDDYIYHGKNSELSSLESSINKIDYVKKNNINKTKIKVSSLDVFSKNENINNIDFIKIDTEGHELKVLNGAKQFIESNKIKIIQLEFNWHHLMTNNTLLQFSEILKDYKVFQLNSYNGKILEVNPSDYLSNIYCLSNFVFINKIFYHEFKKSLL